MSNVINKFLNYIKYETTSCEDSNTTPSTNTQLQFAKILKNELKNMGLKDTYINQHGYVSSTLPSNINKKIPTIGFIAHMDTSPEISGKGVNAKIIKNYNGKDILLNKEQNIILSPKNSPELKNYIGKTLITTDGTTLLGADDKAGIAEIMTSIEYLIKNPNVLHGTIKIAFTPDEEIGRGANFFDTKKFGADYAYTVDGGPIGELEYENFNAAKAKITINGRNVHPGSAKEKMINSMFIAMELNSILPVNQKPEFTEGYEGFYHLTNIKGNVEKTIMNYIIRDHNKNNFKLKKQTMLKTVDFLNYKYNNVINLNLEDEYYNMKEKITPVIQIVDIAKKAIQESAIDPIITPIRGGTDGARLSYMGLPCPNIFTGGHNFHGRYEYIPTFAMEKAVEVILKIIDLYTKISLA